MTGVRPSRRTSASSCRCRSVTASPPRHGSRSNCGAASVLLVHNEAGGLDADAAIADPAFVKLARQIGQPARLPHLGMTMADVHRTSTPPHAMIAGQNRFEAQGALTMIRTVEAAFLDHPEFRPW